MHRTYSMRKSRAPTASQIEVIQLLRRPRTPGNNGDTDETCDPIESPAAALEHKAPPLRPQWTW